MSKSNEWFQEESQTEPISPLEAYWMEQEGEERLQRIQEDFIPKTYFQGILFLEKLRGHDYKENHRGQLSLKVFVNTYSQGYCKIIDCKTKKLIGVFDHHPASFGEPKDRKYKAVLYIDRFPMLENQLSINICAYEGINPKSPFDLYINDLSSRKNDKSLLGSGTNSLRKTIIQ